MAQAQHPPRAFPFRMSAVGNDAEAAVVVLGDIGRSPRMCNHALMLAEEGFEVKLIGFYDSRPDDAIVNHPRIKISALQPPPDAFDRLPSVAQLPLKLLWNAVELLFAMMFFTSFTKLRLILMQNPPALPTMPVCFLISRIKKSKLTIDWHNYMYSILADKYELSHDDIFGAARTNDKWMQKNIVRYVYRLERFCGRFSNSNLCVTNAMKRDLSQRWGVPATTFYDRPPSWKFRKVDLNQIHDLFMRLSATDEGRVLRCPSGNDNANVLTELVDGVHRIRDDCPFVLMSSTSWTTDERFDILFDAIVAYDEKCRQQDGERKLPRILLIITGKGPLKSMYMQQIAEKNLEFVDVMTPWLEAQDYPVMIASCHMGVSLHVSTSGRDLPMKVVDMFGMRKPVLAKNFECITELVDESVNGRLFEDSNDLADLLTQMAGGFKEKESVFNQLRITTENMNFSTWEPQWREVARRGGGLALPNAHQRRVLEFRAILNFICLAVMAVSIAMAMCVVFWPVIEAFTGSGIRSSIQSKTKPKDEKFAFSNSNVRVSVH